MSTTVRAPYGVRPTIIVRPAHARRGAARLQWAILRLVTVWAFRTVRAVRWAQNGGIEAHAAGIMLTTVIAFVALLVGIATGAVVVASN